MRFQRRPTMLAPLFPMTLHLLGTIPPPPQWMSFLTGEDEEEGLTTPTVVVAAAAARRALSAMEVEYLKHAEVPNDQKEDCVMCSSTKTNTYMVPCGCKVCCAGCAPRTFETMKKCVCGTPIEGIQPCIVSSTIPVKKKAG